MTRQDIEKHVTNILAEYLNINKEQIYEDSDLALDLGADSLDEEELAVVLEVEFNIDIPDNMHYLTTPRAIVDYLCENLL